MNPTSSIDRAPRPTWWRRPPVALGVLGVVLLTACGSSKSTSSATTVVASTKVTVAAADFPESQVIAEIYAEQLEKAGVRVARKAPIGSRELYYKAISNNEIQLIPEYTNSLLSYVLRQSDPNANPDPSIKTVDDQIAALKKALPSTLTVGVPSSAEDKDVIVCSPAVAEKYKLKTLSDLAKVADQITLGAPPEFQTRSPFGIEGLKTLYGANFKQFVPLKIDVIADNLKSGAIDCGNMFSTMSAILTNSFVALDDDKTIVAHEAVLPLLTTAAATPAVTVALQAVSEKLTTDVLKSLMVKVEVDKQSPEQAAKAFMATLSTGS